MTIFDTPADDYDRFMGRYLPSLAPAFVEAAGIAKGMRVLDVGCGPGGLTHELAQRFGADNVAAVDPAPQFVRACASRNPGVDVREGAAEDLPWADNEFDAVLSSLAIGFMTDADRGLREMARVTRAGGRVAVCMWDIVTGGMTMLETFWAAVRHIDPGAAGESGMAGTGQGDIAERMRRVGVTDVVDGHIDAHADYTDFGEFWEPFTLGVGPAGRYLHSLPLDRRDRVRAACRESLPDGPFRMNARAWMAWGTTISGPVVDRRE
jgi:ubiquinone/menaquinone biosynthesis C-methylase UbiE